MLDKRSVINLHEVSWRYEDRKDPALHTISLAVSAGIAVGITGASGSGKSTLLLAVAGLIPANYAGELAGEVHVDGEIGIVFQDPETQFIGLTVEEEIAFALENRGCSDAEIERRIEAALDTVGLVGFEKRSPFELSGGEKQRVAIASALATEPAILVLDDPTSELDPVGATEVFSLLSELKRDKQMTIVVSSHAIEELADVCDRLVLMDQGQIIKDTTAQEFFAEPDEIDAYGIYVPDLVRLRQWIAQEDMVVKRSTAVPQAAVQVAIGDDTVIQLENVSFGYVTNHRVLKNIDLSINKGEFVCLAGGNGSGKTTLAKHFNGLYKPTCGDVIVQGLNTRDMSVIELACEVSYCYQNPDHQIFQSTIWGEVAFGPKNLGLHEQEVRERVSEALRAVGLEHLREEDPSFVGKGDRQKIAVASVLAMKPKVIVLDEPTTGLDHKGVTEMMDLIARMNQAGHTIIAVTHDMRLISQYASRLVVLYQGEIVVDGSPQDVFTQSDLLRQAQIQPPAIVRFAVAAGFTEPLPLTLASVQGRITQEDKTTVRGISL